MTPQLQTIPGIPGGRCSDIHTPPGASTAAGSASLEANSIDVQLERFYLTLCWVFFSSPF